MKVNNYLWVIVVAFQVLFPQTDSMALFVSCPSSLNPSSFSPGVPKMRGVTKISNLLRAKNSRFFLYILSFNKMNIFHFEEDNEDDK